MAEGKCDRCQWPLVNNPEKGCIVDKCSCTCERYPKCPCGTFDGKNEPEPIKNSLPLPGYIQPSDYRPIATQEPTFVLMNYPTDAKGEVVYIGNDKSKAFDKLMQYGKDNYCQICDLKIVRETD